MALKNILKGITSINLFPEPTELNPNNLTPEQQDAQALAQDWREIGKDIYNAIDRFEQKYHIN